VTGGELAAAASVGKAVEKVLKEDDQLKAQLREQAKDSPAMKAAAEAHAKRIAVKQEMLLKLFMPLALMLGISRGYFESQFSADMSEKIKDVPEEDLVPPKPSIAGPTMQALGYSLDEPDLKEMYLQLLATAVDGRRSDQAHPSFVEVIRQLSADEARLLTVVLNETHSPIIRITRTDQSDPAGGFSVLQSHVINWVDRAAGDRQVEHPSSSVYVDNWIRLGLITVAYDTWLTRPNAYNWADTRPEVTQFRAALQHENILVSYDRGHLSATAFGLRFKGAVVPQAELDR
jgi:hypothetical protein